MRKILLFCLLVIAVATGFGQAQDSPKDFLFFDYLKKSYNDPELLKKVEEDSLAKLRADKNGNGELSVKKQYLDHFDLLIFSVHREKIISIEALVYLNAYARTNEFREKLEKCSYFAKQKKENYSVESDSSIMSGDIVDYVYIIDFHGWFLQPKNVFVDVEEHVMAEMNPYGSINPVSRRSFLRLSDHAAIISMRRHKSGKFVYTWVD